MSTKSGIKKRIAKLPTWQLVLGSAAVVATGGGLAYYAIAQGGLAVVAGNTMLLAGPAAKAWASK